jgi:hypothetical protein
MNKYEQIITIFIFICAYSFLQDKKGENMLSIIDLSSIGVVIGSYLIIAYNIRSELKNSVEA